MPVRNVAVFVGGISAHSLNQKLFRALEKLAPPELKLTNVEIKELPFFNQDLESDLPERVRNLKAAIESADAVLFVTPEYNRSYPGVLKNAIDWGSRPYGKNSWAGKPAGILGASLGALGTSAAQLHLRQTLLCLNMATLPQPEFYLNAAKAFDEEGNLIDEKAKGFAQTFWKSYTAWIEKLSPAR